MKSDNSIDMSEIEFFTANIRLTVDYGISCDEAKSRILWSTPSVTDEHFEKAKLIGGKFKNGIEKIDVKIILFRKLFFLSCAKNKKILTEGGKRPSLEEEIKRLGFAPINLVEMFALAKVLPSLKIKLLENEPIIISTGFNFKNRKLKDTFLSGIKIIRIKNQYKSKIEGYADFSVNSAKHLFAVKDA